MMWNHPSFVRLKPIQWEGTYGETVLAEYVHHEKIEHIYEMADGRVLVYMRHANGQQVYPREAVTE